MFIMKKIVDKGHKLKSRYKLLVIKFSSASRTDKN